MIVFLLQNFNMYPYQYTKSNGDVVILLGFLAYADAMTGNGKDNVGVMGDNRTSKLTIALRAVTSVDGMTADIYDFKTNDLKEISTEIINNVPQVNRVVYDITTKPPATIEWE